MGVPVFEFARTRSASGLSGLPGPFNRPSIAVLHDTYVPVHARIVRHLQLAGVPYVIVPHGGMTKDAQKVKPLKKRLGNLLFFNGLVAGAVAVHFLTQGEREESTRWAKTNFVVGNGIAIPSEEWRAQPGKSRNLVFAYVGRLDTYQKGLGVLLQACSLCRADLAAGRGRVLLYGPDHEGDEARLRQRAAAEGLAEVVAFCGPVLGERKHRAFAESDVFLHPSRTEGHPLAVLEALAHGVPCLLTPGTNVSSEVAAAGAGWEVSLSATGIAQGFRKILAHREDLPQAGRRARDLAIREYGWQRVAELTVGAYRRCLGAA
jgi:glycosyltransferase involved in cell wall biosynthesis